MTSESDIDCSLEKEPTMVETLIFTFIPFFCDKIIKAESLYVTANQFPICSQLADCIYSLHCLNLQAQKISSW
jgi:hypothetical protein